MDETGTRGVRNSKNSGRFRSSMSIRWTGSVRRYCRVQLRETVAVGVRVKHQGIGRFGDMPPLDRVAEPRQRLACVAEIRIERYVVPVRFEDVVEAPLDQELAGAGCRRLE